MENVLKGIRYSGGVLCAIFQPFEVWTHGSGDMKNFEKNFFFRRVITFVLEAIIEQG